MKHFTVILLVLLTAHAVQAQEGPEINPHGITFPKMTAPPHDSLSTKGMIIYNTSSDLFQTYDGSVWVNLIPPGGINEKIEENDSRVEVFDDANSRVGVIIDGTTTALINRTAGNMPQIDLPNSNNNTFVGTSAGEDSRDTAFWNTAIGRRALQFNKGGDRNVAIGGVALRNNTGSWNVGVGVDAGASNTGSANILVGFEAGRTGNQDYNVMIGHESGDNGNAAESTFVGTRTGRTVSGFGNSGFGFEALSGVTSGNRNLALGYQSGRNTTQGSQNTYVGTYSGQSNATGDFNTFLGTESGQFSGNGDFNVYLGYTAGKNNDGSGNVFIGPNAGRSVTKTSNRFILSNSLNNDLIVGQFSNSLASRHIHISGDLRVEGEKLRMPDNNGAMDRVLERDGNDVKLGDIDNNSGEAQIWAGGGERITIHSNGDVGIGDATPGSKLEVNGDLRLVPKSSETCNVNSDVDLGKLYYDSDTHQLLLCYKNTFTNLNGWIPLN